MKNLKYHLTRFLEAGVIISTLLLIASVTVQIYARFFLENTPVWTEEASRFFFIYTIAFSSGIAFSEGYFVSMDIVYQQLKERMKKIVNIFNQGLIIVLFTVISIFSIQCIIMGQSETSASLGLKMSFAFTSILVLALSLSFYGIDQLLRFLKEKK